MDKNKLYSLIVDMVPVSIEENNDYRGTVRNCLNNYLKYLSELNIKFQPSQWKNTLTRIGQLCSAINRAIQREYQGMRHSAYAAIKNQLDGYKTATIDIQGLAYGENLKVIKTGMTSYRMRKVELEEQHNIKREDLFHIPMDKKGLVQTQRYSVPGFPCLYLSHCVYGCWEEMGRPDYGKVMVSKFVTQKKIQVLDLRIPSIDQWNTDMERVVKFFPIVLASMVQVKNNKDFYKPEYLIPQLITEWVISHNTEKDEGIVGILFTSAKKNKDFNYPNDCFDNYAIPVMSPLSSKKYCKKLTEIFKLSEPTYYDLETLKHTEDGSGILLGMSTINNPKVNYSVSHFGKMEKYLKNKTLEEVKHRK